jgi:cell division protein FtsL
MKTTRAGVKRDSQRRLPSLVACLALLVLTVGALGHVGIQTAKLEYALELGREQRDKRNLLEERRRLESVTAQLRDPGRIASLARSELNMQSPAPTALYRTDKQDRTLP